jgi:hypothetical protein
MHTVMQPEGAGWKYITRHRAPTERHIVCVRLVQSVSLAHHVQVLTPQRPRDDAEAPPVRSYDDSRQADATGGFPQPGALAICSSSGVAGRLEDS